MDRFIHPVLPNTYLSNETPAPENKPLSQLSLNFSDQGI